MPVIRAYYFWIPLICLICTKVARLKSKHFTAHSFTQYIDSKYFIEIELDDKNVVVRTRHFREAVKNYLADFFR